ncbi:MAG: DUF116 domain-containing protein [Candidatus Eisenbacteria bacterium]
MQTTRLGPMWREGERNARSRVRSGEGKGLFVLLSFVSTSLLLVLLWFLFYLAEPRLSALGSVSSAIVRACVVLITLLALALVVAEALSVSLGLRLVPRFVERHWTVGVALPLCERLGRLFGASSDSVRASFLELNNAVAVARARSLPGTRASVLLILPHCLQDSSCSRHLIADIGSCARCGTCDVSRLGELVERYPVKVRIAGGGAAAVRIVDEMRPDAVVGVACERELVAAIREVGEAPVIAIPNWRPEGPCRNTRVAVADVERALRILLKEPGEHCSMQ